MLSCENVLTEKPPIFALKMLRLFLGLDPDPVRMFGSVKISYTLFHTVVEYLREFEAICKTVVSGA
jgi:hypothetical protein